MNWIIFFISFSALAETTDAFTLLLTRGNDKSWYSVSEVKGKSVCASNHVPYFEADSNPIKDVDWAQIQKESNSKHECKDRVAFAYKGKRAVNCAELPYTAKLLLKITTACRTNI